MTRFHIVAELQDDCTSCTASQSQYVERAWYVDRVWIVQVGQTALIYDGLEPRAEAE